MPAVMDAIKSLLERFRGRAREVMRDEDRREEESYEIGESVYLQEKDRPHEFENSTHASGYFKKAIENKLKDKAGRRHAKKRKPERPILSIGNVPASTDGVVDPAAPEAELDLAEYRAWMRARLDGMSPQDRSLMEGWALGLPSSEYAKIAGMEKEAARQRVSRLLKQLKARATGDDGVG